VSFDGRSWRSRFPDNDGTSFPWDSEMHDLTLYVGFRLVEHDAYLEARRFDRVIKQLESPIEQAMFTALVLEAREFGHMRVIAPDASEWRRCDDEINGITIQCQAPIDRYRADFAITCRQQGWAMWGAPGEPDSDENTQKVHCSKLFVVECDGHDFHERTREQASRDKARDRAMQAMGFVVLRFSGSDLWRDPRGCAQSAVEQAWQSTEAELERSVALIEASHREEQR